MNDEVRYSSYGTVWDTLHSVLYKRGIVRTQGNVRVVTYYDLKAWLVIERDGFEST